MKEYLFQQKKKMRTALSRLAGKLLRLFVSTRLSRSASFRVPVIINNRNRLDWLKQMVAWLKQAGYVNIYVLDNASSYPPLLDYYATGEVKVLKLGHNGGYMSLWSSDYFHKVRRHYYVYTDPDVLPGPDCPHDIVFRLYQVLKKYRHIDKCGVALRIDDLPAFYARRQEVTEKIEGRYWKTEVEPDVYDAPVDTTFALYRPYAQGNAEECRAYRLGGRCTWRHMPWYEDSLNPGAESLYYQQHADTSSTWYSPGRK